MLNHSINHDYTQLEKKYAWISTMASHLAIAAHVIWGKEVACSGVARFGVRGVTKLRENNLRVCHTKIL